MADAAGMPKYDGMEYEELVANAQFLWLENQKLLDYFEHKAIIHGMYSAKQRSDRLVDENDKLRELVRDWWAFAVGGADSLSDWNAQQADLESRMRELGIEVDG